MTSDRVEIQVRIFCTHPDAKQGEGCPEKAIWGKSWKCVLAEAGEDGEASICDYLEVEAAKKGESGKSES